ncbi:MAG TPA: three-Cys-motif partner protein TcmP [Kineosporiaceae bacterium]
MDQVPWEAEPHTKAKHALYRRYLSHWTPIMMQGWGGKATYAEGFAGPGVYLDGSPGSPVIAIRSLLDRPDLKLKVRNFRFLFVDNDQRCCDLLGKRLRAATAQNIELPELRKHGIDVEIVHGPCEPTLEQLLTHKGAWGSPMLVVLDTWGGAVPLDLVRRVASNRGSEVIITIQPQYFSRFAATSDIDHGDRVFGGTSWRRVAEQAPQDKARWLLQHYRETIRSAGFRYVLDFELIDKRGQALYLVFGTTHARGLQRMKEAMWEVDDVYGVGYRDPRDPDQEALDIELQPQTAPLRRLLRDHLATLHDHRATIDALHEFALYHTVFKESQVRPVAMDMIAQGELVRCDGGTLSRRSVVGLP